MTARGRQPGTFNAAIQTNWKLLIKRTPTLEFFVTEFQPPSVTLGVAKQSTPLDSIPLEGDRLYRSDLQLQFIVDEKWANYDEIYDWMVDLARPQDSRQYRLLKEASPEQKLVPNLAGVGRHSDIAVYIATSKRNATTEWAFLDCFPVALTVPRFTYQDTTVKPIVANVQFAFRHFVLNRVGEDTARDYLTGQMSTV